MTGCALYFRTNDVLVVPEGRTVGGFRILTEPFFKTSLPASEETIGEIALLALRSASDELPDSVVSSSAEGLPKFAGVRSWNAVEKGSRLVAIWKQDDQHVVVPHRSEKGSFYALTEREAVTELLPKEVGRLVLQKAEECE